MSSGCQNPATRTAWINVLTGATEKKKGCIGYLLLKNGKNKWKKAFFSIFDKQFSYYESKLKGHVPLLDSQLNQSVTQATIIDPETQQMVFGNRFTVSRGVCVVCACV